MMSIKRIRRCVRTGKLEFTAHALEEMDDDELTQADVRNVLLRGVAIVIMGNDPRGSRYVIGHDVNGRPVDVVCRMLPSGRLRIVTVYTLEE